MIIGGHSPTVAKPFVIQNVTYSSSGGVNADLNIIEDADTLSAATALTITPNLSVTEADDTLSSNSNLLIQASVSIIETADTLISTTGILIQSNLSVTEANDTLSANATTVNTITASLTITEASDILASTATLPIQTNLSVTEANDGLSASSALQVNSNLTITEASDSLAGNASVGISSSLSKVEANDTLNANSISLIQANLSIAEASDTLSATTTTIGAISATLSIVEANDTLLSVTNVIHTISFDLTETNDVILAVANLEIKSNISIVEANDSLASSALTGGSITANLNIIEGNDILVAIVSQKSVVCIYHSPIPEPVAQPIPADIPRVIINTAPPEPIKDEPILHASGKQLKPVDYDPWANLGMAGVEDKSGQSEHPLLKQLFGLGGEERYQLWPERMVRAGATAAGNVMSGQTPQWAVDPETGDVHTSPQMIEAGLDTAALAGTGGLAGTTEATLGSGPFLRPALKHNGIAIEAMKKPTFYSALEHGINKLPDEALTGEQWLNKIWEPETTKRVGIRDENNKVILDEKGQPKTKEVTVQGKSPLMGVKPEELQWTGLSDFLAENKGKPVTKEQIQQHLEQNKVELKEVSKGANPDLDRWKELDSMAVKTPAERSEYENLSRNSPNIGDTKYHGYQLPGGENYREMLMTLPNPTKQYNEFIDSMRAKYGQGGMSKLPLTEAERAQYNKVLSKAENAEDNPPYKSSHWDEPNILAHVRMNDRTIEGKKSLHVEEIQSDWHQQGREKGYKGPEPTAEQRAEINRKLMAGEKLTDFENVQLTHVGRVPDAPFKKTWHELALKRMLREAAEKGYDRLSWTPGEAQAARYDLSKSVDKLQYNPTTEKLLGHKGKSLVVDQTVSKDKLGDFVGKEAAKKLLENPTARVENPNNKGTFNHHLEGQDLKIGGEGMKGFYDKMIPNALEKMGKEHGVKVKQSGVEAGVTQVYKGPEYTTDTLRTKIGEFNRSNAPVSMANQTADIIKVMKTGTSFKDAIESHGSAALMEKLGGKRVDVPKQAPVHYIDIPQSLKDTVLRKGQPLFAAGVPLPLMPVDHDPWEKKNATKEK